MIALKCPMCMANLEIKSKAPIVKCLYCDSSINVSEHTNNMKNEDSNENIVFNTNDFFKNFNNNFINQYVDVEGIKQQVKSVITDADNAINESTSSFSQGSNNSFTYTTTTTTSNYNKNSTNRQTHFNDIDKKRGIIKRNIKVLVSSTVFTVFSFVLLAIIAAITGTQDPYITIATVIVMAYIVLAIIFVFKLIKSIINFGKSKLQLKNFLNISFK